MELGQAILAGDGVGDGPDPSTYGSAASLTAAMAIGEAAAVEAFYRRYFDRLYAEARRATNRDESFCLDVVQDAVLKVVRTIRPVESEAQLVAWLKLVVRTAAFDLIRAERRRAKRELTRGLVTRTETPDLELEERSDWLRRKIGELDPGIVRLIELRYSDDWTLGRIAAWVGVSIGTVDGRLRRAIKSLRDAAAEAGHVE